MDASPTLDIKKATETSRLWNASTPGIELFEARLLHHRFGKHFHEGYTIGFNESGQGQCLHQGKVHTHYPNSFNCINPGAVHTGEVAAKAGWAFRNLYLSIPLIQQVLIQLNLPEQQLPHFPNIVVKNPSLKPKFYQLFQALSQPASQLKRDSLLLQFLASLFEQEAQFPTQLSLTRSPSHTPIAKESTAISTLRNYLQTHCTKDISIDQLAQQVNLNPHYLIRCFRQQVGTSPHRYKQHWQLIKAKQALSTEKPIAAIAIEYGFYDQSHFTRTFKRTFGLPPGQYRTLNAPQQVSFFQDRPSPPTKH
ncbi:MAG: AraC family transcriptional regulator [Cyanobacteria bacterium J06614_10]